MAVYQQVTKAAVADHSTPNLRHIDILDGWRAVSILLVMAGHLLPLGPKAWFVNEAVAGTGMAIFFTLSGFLITRFLIEDDNIVRFAVRRVFRIVPLAWVAMPLAILVSGGGVMNYLGNMLFFANLPPFFLVPAGGHFWSLCLEMQFYLGVSLLVGALGRKGLLLLPLVCVAVTLARILFGETMSIVTWFRIDEILAGATVALVLEGQLGERAQRIVAWPNVIALAVLLLLSADRWSGALNFARPYLSALMVGASITCAPLWLTRFSTSRAIGYIARISYALYMFHGIFMNTWLGVGTKAILYAKRPMLIGATFVCAHVSTFHYERFWNRLARRLT
jgi:peptidoglycan/LPS O-acetylase OafA/YrhL